MSNPDLTQAVALHQQGRLDEAERVYRAALDQSPGDVNALHLLGVLRQQQGRAGEAQALLAQALAAAPNVAVIHSNYANALKDLGRLDEAVASYRRALVLDPGFADARYNLGRTLKESGAFTEAAQCFEAVLTIEPHSVEVLTDLGLTFQAQGRFDAAVRPYRQAAALAPDRAEPHHNLGNALYRLGDFTAAELHLRRALDLRPDLADTLVALGNVLKEQGRPEAAIELYERASVVAPDHVQARYNLGCVLQVLKRHDEAAAAFDRVLALDPHHGEAFNGRMTARLLGCDWRDYDADLAAVRARLVPGGATVSPFVTLALPLSPAEQLAGARNFVAATCPPVEPPCFRPRPAGRDRLRIAYLSADFHAHATAFLMAELFERHDRSAFEIFGISFGPDDASAMRARLADGFDCFLDVRAENDAAIAAMLADLGVDIAVDLKGHTKDNRFGVFAHRPAPLQIGYLGYPGTTGASYIDYVIADPIVLPFDQQPFWTERIIHLPGCYQVNDGQRRIAPQIPSRAECGLPERGFVFCCFNNGYKISPTIFEIWMRLLRQMPDSVLWLYRDNGDAERHLRASAATLGVDPARLIFARPQPLEQHLARHRQADLFLDTLPYNAHTTASDALWAGLPVITCRGETFAGRVADSLLTALGLDELVTQTLADYETLALRLARDPAALARIRVKLSQRAAMSALFKAEECRVQIETAYHRIWQTHCRGEAPKGFRIERPGVGE
ncbi:MAG: tetratricopeptide repeat protein [Aliidongia sp.]